MIIPTYKASMKSLLRSVTFWLAMGTFIFIVIQRASGQFHIMNEYYTEWEYCQFMSNLLSSTILYFSLPFFTITTSTLLLTGDYGDSFFEIEKAGGIRPLHYLLGRVFAVTTLVFTVETVLSFAYLYGYTFMNGGVTDHSWGWFFADSALRMTASNMLMALPNILFYTGLTFVCGALFKSGLLGAGGGFLHMIAFYVIKSLKRFDVDWMTYFDYFTPIPQKVRYFCWYTGITDGDLWLKAYDVTAWDVMLNVGWVIGISLLFFFAAWMRLRKREV